MQTAESMATDLVEMIAKRATGGGLFDNNLAYAACMEVLLAYGAACAAEERTKCAGLACLLCRRGVAIEASDEGYGHVLSGRWHECKASGIWNADQPGV